MGGLIPRSRNFNMYSREHELRLHRDEKGRDGSFSSLESSVSGSSDMEGARTEEDLTKDYDPIRSWVEYSKSKTWLMEASRVSADHSTTLSTHSREHQDEVEKWLVQPTVDTLARQLQAKLLVSSKNAPWLMSHALKHDENTIAGYFAAVLSSPNSQWLCKRSVRPAEFAQSASEPKKPRFNPTSSFDPLSGWKTFQEGIDWIASPFGQESEHGADSNDTNSEKDDVCGEEDCLVAFPSVAPTSLSLHFNNQLQMGDDMEKWLLPSSSPLFSSHPLLEPAKPVGVPYPLNQWLVSSRSDSSINQEWEASLLTLSSDYDLMDDL